MRYKWGKGVRRQRGNRWLAVFALLLIVGGVYLLFNTLSPILPQFGYDPQTTAKTLQTNEAKVGDNRIYMPKINVDVAIVEIEGDEAAALDKGAIHRAPDNGNPKDGGNFVVAAHRFTLGITPEQTRLKSPFYHIDQMQVGDEIYVDYDGVRYAYEIYEKKTVPPTAVDIEARTSDPRMTVYTCELSGSRDGREVLFAKPIGTVSLDGNQTGIKTL